MINIKGINLIKEFESLHDGDLTQIGLQPKMCPAGIWTVGYGRALRAKDGHFLRGMVEEAEAYKQFPSLTELEACNMLAEDLEEFAHSVRNLLTIIVNEDQFAALVSFTYNLGYGSFRASTLRTLVNQGDFTKAAEEFKRWNKSGGKVLVGLTRRREAERKLFLSI
jgi:lysozyme